MLTAEGANQKRTNAPAVMLTAEGANQHLKKATKGNFGGFLHY